MTLVFDSGTVEGSITEWPVVLYDGTLEIDGEASENIIPIPLERKGNIQLTLKPSFMDEPIVVRDNRVHLELKGALQFTSRSFPVARGRELAPQPMTAVDWR